MTTPVRYGVLGCGMMGQEHIRNIFLQDGASVAAIFEPDAGMQAIARSLAPEAAVVDCLADLLAVDAVDALLIASPNHLHLGQIEEILACRPLPLLVEKPLFTAAEDVKRVERLIADYPQLIWVAMEYRYMPPIAKFLKEVGSATGGIRMLTIREHRFPFLAKVGNWNRFSRNTGGTLVEKCCHFFDLMRLATGAEPVRIMASGGQAVNHLDESYAGESPDIWDNAYVIVDFANGARTMLELCMFAEGGRFQEEISAVGPNGKIEAFVPGPGRFWPDHLGAPPVPKVVVSPRQPKGPSELSIPIDPVLLDAGDHNGATYYQHKYFLEAIRGDRPPDVTISDGFAAVRMGLAAQESARTGAAVTL